jgi:hypothetical protein
VEALDGLLLASSVLGAETEDAGAVGAQLGVVIAEGARLRRAATGAGDIVPAGRDLLVWPAGSGVSVDNGPPRQRGKVHGRAVCRREWDRRQRQSRQVGAGAVVGRNGEVDWEAVKVIGTGQFLFL